MTGTERSFGIYLNPQELKVVRVSSPYWIPHQPPWVFLTPEVNATLVRLRELAREKGLASQPEGLTWGNISLVPE